MCSASSFPLPQPQDISSNITADIWRNRMVSGQGLPAWSIVDKKRWQSLEFLCWVPSVTPLFPLFVCLLLNLCFFFFTLLLLLCFNLCAVAQKVWIVFDRCVCVRWCWSRSGDQPVCVCWGVEEGWCWGCQGDTKPPGWGNHAGCHSTGQRAPPAAPMIRPAWQPFDGKGDTHSHLRAPRLVWPGPGEESDKKLHEYGRCSYLAVTPKSSNPKKTYQVLLARVQKQDNKPF